MRGSNIAGKQYGRWTVLKDANKPGNVICECSCGAIKEVRKGHVVSGASRSCGCLRRELASVGRTGVDTLVSKERLHKIWSAMRQRCNNPNHSSYTNYGGKGISVCEEWSNSYKSFRSWALDNGYSEELSIDRVDSGKGYSPENCRWITLGENTTRMLREHYENKTAMFSQEVVDFLRKKNRKNLGRKFSMFLGESWVRDFEALSEAAEYIKEEKGLLTSPLQIKKNISACLHGKRKTCHGYSFKG